MTDLSPGKKFKKEIHYALKNANILAPVITKNTYKSKWIKKEIVHFKNLKPKAKIVPLVFDYDINLDNVIHGLGEYHTIDFSKC